MVVSSEPGPVGLCGTVPLWTTYLTTCGGQTVWKVVTAVGTVAALVSARD